MLEQLPHAVGERLPAGPGLEATVYFGGDVAGAPETIHVTSEAFASGAAIPARYTAD